MQLPVVFFVIVDDLAVRVIIVVHKLCSVSELNEDVVLLVIYASVKDLA